MTEHFSSRFLSKNAMGTLLTTIASLCYGISPVLVKMQFAFGLNSSSVLTYRAAIATILMLIILCFQKTSLRLARQDGLRFAMVGFLGTAAMLLLTASYAYINVGLTTALHYTYPIFVNLVSAIFFKITLTKARVFSLLLGISGVFMLSLHSESSTEVTGVILAILSGLFFAIYMISLEHTTFSTVNRYVIALHINVAIFVFSLLFNVVTGNLRPITSGRSIVYLILLALLNSVIAMLCFRAGVLLLGAAKAAVISTSEPVFSVLFGLLLLGEPIALTLIIGLVFILLGLAVANVRFFQRSD